MSENNERIEIKIDQSRFAAIVTVDQLILMQEGNIRAIRDVLAHFVWDDGIYLPYPEALKRIGKLTLQQLADTAARFVEKAEESVSPFGSGQG